MGEAGARTPRLSLRDYEEVGATRPRAPTKPGEPPSGSEGPKSSAPKPGDPDYDPPNLRGAKGSPAPSPEKKAAERLLLDRENINTLILRGDIREAKRLAAEG